ncbi:hypothetical protein DDB_G0288579 [Dictyostelium discoideum AX4]|uniref:Uncharacterized protein n=1 Tax=Dictyostelium discoideum TaxID=44689 RepID=Q54IR0_DICDI|nr:hypothetical protein DDB_G0288579 [Dictyostelium discoideum AX4]EAL63149.1 hypothetical protein DDB_G0288579 [Dictyostelium discoideum AX4]|eukprot:XP_636654.1 hypothetical protein DDB_G0288579 [Dictyostelium discoideum AX4]
MNNIITVESCNNTNKWNNTFYLKYSDHQINYTQRACWAIGVSGDVVDHALVSIDSNHYRLTVTFDGNPSKFRILRGDRENIMNEIVTLNGTQNFTIHGLAKEESIKNTALHFQHIQPDYTFV